MGADVWSNKSLVQIRIERRSFLPLFNELVHGALSFVGYLLAWRWLGPDGFAAWDVGRREGVFVVGGVVFRGTLDVSEYGSRLPAAGAPGAARASHAPDRIPVRGSVQVEVVASEAALSHGCHGPVLALLMGHFVGDDVHSVFFGMLDPASPRGRLQQADLDQKNIVEVVLFGMLFVN